MPATAQAPAQPAPAPSTPAPKPSAPSGPPVEAPRAEKRSMESYFDEKPQPKPTPRPQPKRPDPKPEPQQPAPEPPEPSEPEAAEEPAQEPDAEPSVSPDDAKPAIPDPLSLDVSKLLGNDDVLPKPAPKPVERTPKELRKAYEALKAEREQLARKVKEYEPLASVKEQLEQVAKERDEYAAKLEQVDYVESPKYKEQWEKPFVDKLDGLYREAKRLPADDASRVGSEADINEIYTLWGRNPAAAIQKATETFGIAGQHIINRVSELHEFQGQRDAALENWKQTRTQRRQQEQEEAARKNQIKANAYLGRIEAERAQFKDLFDYDGDKELKPVWDQSAQYADAVVYGIDENKNITDEERWAHKASLRNKAAAFAPLVVKTRKLEARVKELEKELEGFRSSEPPVNGGRGDSKAGGRSVYDRADDYFK